MLRRHSDVWQGHSLWSTHCSQILLCIHYETGGSKKVLAKCPACPSSACPLSSATAAVAAAAAAACTSPAATTLAADAAHASTSVGEQQQGTAAGGDTQGQAYGPRKNNCSEEEHLNASLTPATHQVWGLEQFPSQRATAKWSIGKSRQPAPLCKQQQQPSPSLIAMMSQSKAWLLVSFAWKPLWRLDCVGICIDAGPVFQGWSHSPCAHALSGNRE